MPSGHKNLELPIDGTKVRDKARWARIGVRPIQAATASVGTDAAATPLLSLAQKLPLEKNKSSDQRISLNRSQHKSCSTGYNPLTSNQVVYK